MDIQTKKYMLYAFTVVLIMIVGMEVYKVIFSGRSLLGGIILSLFAIGGYSITYLVLNHDIKKFERWKMEALEFTTEAKGLVSDLSLSSTRENGRNTVILSATYNDYEVTFSGIDPDYQFKYKVGDNIDLLVHEHDKQRFVLKDLKEEK
jgi:hypothetical protein